MRVSRLLSLGALLTSTIAITSTIVLTPVEQSPYYYLGCYPYTAETAIGAFDMPNIATGYNSGNPFDCQIGCDQQFHASYVFVYGTYCYCQVREVEFDIHQPGGAPVDNSFCTRPRFVDPNAPPGPDIIDSNWELEHLYNIEVFNSLYVSPKSGHFEKLDLFYEPKQHGSGYEVLNVHLHHSSKVRYVHIHKNNRQHPTVLCEPVVLVPRLRRQ